MSNWLNSSTPSNRLRSTFVKGFVDVSGGDIINRNGDIIVESGDISANGNLSVTGTSDLKGDVIITGNLKADKIVNDYIINTETTNYTLMVTEDLSLNGDLNVKDNATINKELTVNGNTTLSGTLNNITTTELSHLDGVTSNIQTQISSKQDTIVGAATTIANDDLTSNRALISNGDGKVGASSVTSTEISYLDGVTSAIQTQFTNMQTDVDSKEGTINGGASTITTDDLTLNRALISDSAGKVSAHSTVSTTELGYLNGAASFYFIRISLSYR